MNHARDIGEPDAGGGAAHRPSRQEESAAPMRVMPYATHRGAMLLGDAPKDSPFATAIPAAAASPIDAPAFVPHFELTSGDAGDERPGRFTRGAERGWRSLRPVSQ
jgi:hypothetical protein